MADVFLSYVRADHSWAARIADALISAGIDTWYDVQSLLPGQDWYQEISNAFGNAKVIVVLVSEASMKSQSIQIELAAARASETPIIPVVVDRLPGEISVHIKDSQLLFIKPEAFHIDVVKLIEGVSRLLVGSTSAPTISEADAKRASAAIAEELRSGREGARSRSVFVVHGHDAKSLEDVEAFLLSNRVEPIVLTRLSGGDQSLFQRFMRFGREASFAVVILSSDDYGAGRYQYDADGVGERSLQFRARQNVILELGFFYGWLGWENVFVLFKSPESVFPNFERPSDLDGVVFVGMDGWIDWRSALKERLVAANLI